MAQQAVDGDKVLARAGWRILPLLGLSYLVAFMDRSNISFAARTMNADLGFSATVYGIGGGLFFLSYAVFEVPSNVILARVGARRWIARIMITWGVLAAAMLLVQSAWQFYTLRFLLGAAEAGFFPGVIFYLSRWFPREARGRAISRFYISGPLTRVVMGVASVVLLGLGGRAFPGLGVLRGWQWLFLGEGLPAVLVGLLVLAFLPDEPGRVAWLSASEKAWLADELARDGDQPAHPHVLRALRHPMVLLLGLVGFLTTAAYFTFTLSEPQILGEVTGWPLARVGWLVSAGGLVGAAGMLFTGWLSDRMGRREPFLVVSTAIVLVAYLIFAFGTGRGASPVAGLVGYGLFVMAWGSVTLSVWMLCADRVPPVAMAAGTAIINALSQAGAFVAPIAWGVARDATGGFHLGFIGLVMLQVLALSVGMGLLVARHSKKGVAAHAARGKGS